MERRSGILLHPTSLPGEFGGGDLGPSARRFLDWLVAAGQSLWQFLPLAPPGQGNSPYDAVSAFAGNPLLISPHDLVTEGLLEAGDLEHHRLASSEGVDFAAAEAVRGRLLRLAWGRFEAGQAEVLREGFATYLDAPGQVTWLDDWCLFAALKTRRSGQSWGEWPADLRRREPAALAAARRELAGEILYQAFLQFLFDRQMSTLRAEAHRRGVILCGDLPLYVAFDSAEVWSRRELFAIDEEGQCSVVAGVPPDYFSPEGQRWGHPLYHWERIREQGFNWWIERVRAALRCCDWLRLDHFRGLAAYWEIPAAAPTASAGRWVEAPGEELLLALERSLGSLPLIAEDLGQITPEVHALRRRFSLPGMKVLQFAFGAPDSQHLPHHLERRSVIYTGTHDNDTTRGWFSRLEAPERLRVLDYLGGNGEDVVWRMIRAALTSVAAWAVIPIQDVLELSSAARMNVPGRAADNWGFRLRDQQLDRERANRLRRLAAAVGRPPPERG